MTSKVYVIRSQLNTAELSFGSSRSTEIRPQLFTRSSRNKCHSFSISSNFYQTNLLLSPQLRYMFDLKESFLIDALKIIPGETRDDLLRIPIDLLKVNKTSVDFITIVTFQPVQQALGRAITIRFQVKIKCQTDQPLDHKNNPLECQQQSLKHLEKLLEGLDKPLEHLGKTLERARICFMTINRLSLVYFFPKRKVTYLGGQVGNQA